MRRRPVLHAAVLGVFLAVLGTSVSAAPSTDRVHFTAAGDWAQTSNTAAVLDAIHGAGSDFTMTLGDMSYGTVGDEQSWCDFVKTHVGDGYPFEMISGNHESNGLNGNINDFSACLPNQLPGAVGTYGRQYYVDVPAEKPLVRFVMISPGLTYPDGTWSYAAGTARYAWTAQAIDGARAAAIPWVVVGMHKPCVSVGRYGCDSGADLFNLLLSKKVDLVLSGHDHSYQRTQQLGLTTGCPTFQPAPAAYNPACVVDADNSFTAGAGTVSMVIGVGGQLSYEVNDDDVEAPYFATTEGLNKNLAYGALDVTATDSTLSASFLRGSGGTFADAFTITRAPTTNTPPTAVFTSACTNLSCAFDGTGSRDPDGSLTGYTWNFGDGTSGTGPNPTHAYAAAGSYTVSLTVTDDGGASGTASNNVTATAPPAATFASDDFSRTSAAGWGAAPTGGVWTHVGAASLFAVAGGVGTERNNAGSGPGSYLQSVSAPGVDLSATISLDKIATGSGIYVSAHARRITGQGSYAAKTRVLSTGAVSLELDRVTSSGSEVVLQTATTIPGLTLAAGEALQVRVQAVGSAPTTLRARVWKVGTVEPATWQRSITDATAGLQGNGHVGFSSYLSSSATNAPVSIRFDNVAAVAP